MLGSWLTVSSTYAKTYVRMYICNYQDYLKLCTKNSMEVN